MKIEDININIDDYKEVRYIGIRLEEFKEKLDEYLETLNENVLKSLSYLYRWNIESIKEFVEDKKEKYLTLNFENYNFTLTKEIIWK